MLDLLALAFIAILFVHIYLNLKKSDNKPCEPPSPFRLPFIGHLHYMRKYPKEPWKVFDDLAKKYGEVYKLQLGQCEYVVIAGISAAKEALIRNGNMCLDRPLIATWDLVVNGQRNSLHFANWSTLHQSIRRTLMTHTLSNGSTKLEQLQKVCEKGISKFVTSDCIKCSNLEFDKLLSVYGFMVFDYSCGTDFQDKKSSNDRAWKSFSKAFIELHDVANDGHIINIFPLLKHLKSFFPTIRRLNKFYATLIDFLENEGGLIRIKERLENDMANNRDVDKDLNFAETLIREHIHDPSSLPWPRVFNTVMGLLANILPISSLTMICLGYISLNKEYQEKIHREIKDRIRNSSADGFISLNEARKLVHIEAALMEVIRLASPFYLPRLTTEDIKIKGFHIPRGTGLMVNVYSFDHSPKTWESPEHFMPERFIIEESRNESFTMKIKKPSNYYPYGLGHRSCPGYGLFENLASLMIANLIYRYEISSDLDMGEMSKKGLGNYGSFRAKNSFALNLQERSECL